MSHESSFHGIEVHVIHFLVPLLPGPHVEIVEASLPEAAMARRRRFVPQTHLPGWRAPPLAPPYRAGDALLQHLHHGRRSAHPRLADEQMNMFGHHHVAEQREIVSVAHVGQDTQKQRARCLRAEQRQAMVTAARDEVQLAQAVAAFEAVFHARPRTLHTPKGAAPTVGSVTSVVN